MCFGVIKRTAFQIQRQQGRPPLGVDGLFHGQRHPQSVRVRESNPRATWMVATGARGSVGGLTATHRPAFACQIVKRERRKALADPASL
jgi:hypothetical protein